MKQHKRVTKKFTQKSLTKQSEKDECNINKIMAKYEKTGLVNHVMSQEAVYGDFSQVTDYQDALNKINAAQALFDALPAQIRSKFENDPTLFLEFAQNPENADQLIEMGLAVPKTPDTAPETPPNPSETTQDPEGGAN